MNKRRPSVNWSAALTGSAFVAVVAALYLAQEVFKPIALAVLLAFLLAPIVRGLERIRVPRVPAVLIAVIVAVGVAGGIGYVVWGQAAQFSQRVPTYQKAISRRLQGLSSGTGIVAEIRKAGNDVSKMLKPAPATAPSAPAAEGRTATPVVVVGGPAARAEAESGSGGTSTAATIEMVFGYAVGPIGTVIIVGVFSIFMLVAREDLRDRILRLAGRERLTLTTHAIDDASGRVSRYLLDQTIVNVCVGAAVAGAMWLIGHFNGETFPSPLLWGLLSGLLRFVPYVGIWISAAAPVALSVAVFPHVGAWVETAAAFVVIEITTANAIEPMLFGSSTGMAPLAVLVAAAFWSWLWGPIGLLLSTPLTVCVVVIGRHVRRLQFLAVLLSDEAPLEPADRIYQRLLAGDEHEADRLVATFSKDVPLARFYDDVLLPALTRAEHDCHSGALKEKEYELIRDAIRRQVAAVDATGNPPGSVEGGRMLPVGCEVRVVCLPASDEADEIAGLMLARLLTHSGYCAEAASAKKLVSELVESIGGETPADVVCLSSLPPAAGKHARYLEKTPVERFVGRSVPHRPLGGPGASVGPPRRSATGRSDRKSQGYAGRLLARGGSRSSAPTGTAGDDRTARQSDYKNR